MAIFTSDRYAEDMLSHFYDLYNKNEMCDFFVHTTGRTFRTHRMVLTGASGFFKKLQESESNVLLNGTYYLSGTVVVSSTDSLQQQEDYRTHQCQVQSWGMEVHLTEKDISPDILDRLLEFIYSGNLVICKENVWCLLESATKMDISQAVMLCETFLKKTDNVPEKVLREVSLPETNAYNDCCIKLETSDSSQSACSSTDLSMFTSSSSVNMADLKWGKTSIAVDAENLLLSKSFKQQSTRQRKQQKSDFPVRSTFKKNCTSLDGKSTSSEIISSLQENVPNKVQKIKINSKTKGAKKKQQAVKMWKSGSDVLLKSQSSPNVMRQGSSVANSKDMLSDTILKSKVSELYGDQNKTLLHELINLPNPCDRKTVCKTEFCKRNTTKLKKIKRIRKPSRRCRFCLTVFFFRSSVLLHESVCHRQPSTAYINNRIQLYKSLANKPSYLSYKLKQKKCMGSNKKKANLVLMYRKLDKVKKNRDVSCYNSELCKNKRYLCKMCASHKMTLLHLRRHHVKVHLSQIDQCRQLYMCGECGRVFLHQRNLKRHVKLSHSKSRTADKQQRCQWRCAEENCGFNGKTKRALLGHMNIQHAKVKYECRKCLFQTSVHKELQRHMQCGCSQADRNCDICDKTFQKPFQLRLHNYTVHDVQHPDLKVFKCPFEDCTYSCVTSHLMNKHQSKHSEERRFTCEECGKSLKTALTLEKHIKKLHKGIKPYMCEICGMAYSEEAELKTHIVRHGDRKTFQCSHCDYSSFDKGNFKSHLFNKHRVKMTESMRTFSCNICHYVTDVKSRYKDHMHAHQNIRNVRCPECDKDFVTRNALRGHIIKVHKPKNLRCDFCGYATADISKLKEHLRVMHTHRSFKPYRCAYCDFTCATGGNCRKHVMQKHKDLEVKVIKIVQKMPSLEISPQIYVDGISAMDVSSDRIDKQMYDHIHNNSTADNCSDKSTAAVPLHLAQTRNPNCGIKPENWAGKVKVSDFLGYNARGNGSLQMLNVMNAGSVLVNPSEVSSFLPRTSSGSYTDVDPLDEKDEKVVYQENYSLYQ